MIKLPIDFECRMQDMLKEAYPAFVHSYEDEKYSSLRVNTLKNSVENFMEIQPFGELEQVAWEERGFYYDNSAQPGKHPLHEAGAYYIQEASAMAPAAYLGAKPGERILDLCAAPGGKTTQTASYMENRGILVCNEINPQRAKILSENVERMGIANAFVTNETPKRLSLVFDEYFDRILVDAPCSGEGMFRKNEEAVEEWSLDNVRLCAERQDEILDCADLMLRPGGRLVYSTCTFAPDENEGSIERFITRHTDYKILEVKLYDGMSNGKPEWGSTNMVGLEKTIRLFPHLIKGEGHYLAVLQKSGEVPGSYQGFLANGVQKGIGIRDVKEFEEFAKEAVETGTIEKLIPKDREKPFLKFGDQLYLMMPDMPSTDKLKVLRPGLHLGTLKKNRFEPSHALALYLKRDEVKQSVELCNDGDDYNAWAYLNGQTINSNDGKKGWTLMTYKGYSIGWGKLAGNIIKNHYPKGLRKNGI
jgi:NOL1/NOP2/sun family putative RNA methylase